MNNKDLLADLDDLDQDDSQSQMVDESDQAELNGVKLEDYGVTNVAAQKYSRLLTTNRQAFLNHMESINSKIDNQIMKAEDQNSLTAIQKQQKQEINQNINKSNHYAFEISKQMASISKFIKQIYSKKLPELQSIVNNDGLYAKALLEIQSANQVNESVLAEKKQMFYYLSQHQRISLRISISSPRDPLSKQDQNNVIEAAKIVLELKNHLEALMIYLESYMQIIAPNLCQLVGSAIASKLISTAGGIDKLANMPACNIQVLGGSRSSQVGLAHLQRNHTGVFGQMEVVRDAPKKFQIQLVRMLATNTAKCARADYLGSNNSTGAKLREVMYERFEKIQEQGGLMRIDKPLQIPDMQPKKKRGGKRHRKNKELYQMSEVRKNQNRVKFGEAEEEIQQGVGLGMLKSGTGKLKVNIKKQKLKISKKMEQRANKKSGLQSTLNLDGHQGISLINPSIKFEGNKGQGTESYFSREAGFRTILNNKIGK